MTDANTDFERDAIRRLVQPLRDDEVGLVCAASGCTRRQERRCRERLLELEACSSSTNGAAAA